MQIKELKNPPHFTVITNTTQLVAVCLQAKQQKQVALDTEFVRTSSYFTKLGLIQLYDGEQLSLIDPLLIEDFSPFIELLQDQNVLKILHACREDLSIFKQLFQQLPKPMLDTQILARFVGFSHSVGLAKLLDHYFAIQLDKSETRTNWIKRPLSEKQLNYAAADVWYLLPLYHQMQQDLPLKWQQALAEECEQVLRKVENTSEPDEEKAYLAVANAWKLNSLELMRLKLLAKWRQQWAIERDIALTYVIKSESLWLLAKHNPHSRSEMLSLGLSENEVRIRGKKVLQILAQVKKIKPKDFPPKILRITEFPQYKTAIKLLGKEVKALLPTDLPQETVVTKRHFDELLKWCWLKHKNHEKLPEILQGWRREIGLQLLTILEAEKLTEPPPELEANANYVTFAGNW